MDGGQIAVSWNRSEHHPHIRFRSAPPPRSHDHDGTAGCELMTVALLSDICVYCGRRTNPYALAAYGECDECEAKEHPGLTLIEGTIQQECQATRHSLTITTNGIKRCACGVRWVTI